MAAARDIQSRKGDTLYWQIKALAGSQIALVRVENLPGCQFCGALKLQCFEGERALAAADTQYLPRRRVEVPGASDIQARWPLHT
jgi:hypothetical protein